MSSLQLSFIGNVLIVIGYLSVTINLLSLSKYTKEIKGGFIVVRLFTAFLLTAAIGRILRVYQILFLGIKTFLPFTIFDFITGILAITAAFFLSYFLRRIKITTNFKELSKKIDELNFEQKISQDKLDDTKEKLTEVIKISRNKSI